MRLLLISNSTNAGEAYLEYPKENIRQFLGDIKDGIIFVPYAAVSFSYDEYLTKVQNRFSEFGAKIEAEFLENAVPALQKAIADAEEARKSGKRIVHDNGGKLKIRAV